MSHRLPGPSLWHIPSFKRHSWSWVSLRLTKRRHTSAYRSTRDSGRKSWLKSNLPGRFLELKQKVTIHSHWQTQEAGQQIDGMKNTQDMAMSWGLVHYRWRINSLSKKRTSENHLFQPPAQSRANDKCRLCCLEPSSRWRGGLGWWLCPWPICFYPQSVVWDTSAELVEGMTEFLER